MITAYNAMLKMDRGCLDHHHRTPCENEIEEVGFYHIGWPPKTLAAGKLLIFGHNGMAFVRNNGLYRALVSVLPEFALILSHRHI